MKIRINLSHDELSAILKDHIRNKYKIDFKDFYINDIINEIDLVKIEFEKEEI